MTKCILYFHGTAPTRDFGPPDGAAESAESAESAGLALVRHVRPGYDDTAPQHDRSLQDVARQAVNDALAKGATSIVALGWSGGGPYALAAGSLQMPPVKGVGLLSSWASMNPPDPKLPGGVRFFMKLAQRVRRLTLQRALAVVGRRNPGHVDDVWRTARPWQFSISDVIAAMPVAAWHSVNDPEVPRRPWTTTGVTLHDIAGAEHVPTSDTWCAALSWAKQLLD